ncbi:cAMP-regulated phosphoprotein 19 [Aplysia californica]|uniref:cAMP-regulated phosphoprotein 19 n=1 Tax=Aplysia californica TaxID=6500 RepID=A0ABM0KAX9_APLCA|nr:cAMP-regulated phosphoprotein 19 [Aplysia californica]
MASDATEERTSTPCETVREEDEDNVNDELPPQPQPDKKVIEQREEEKLKSKYPSLAKGGGGSALLNKRLQKGGQKYFDSGDYAMAKAKLSAKQKPPPPPEKIIKAEAVGETIPTPENIQARKPSLVTSKLASGELI